MGVVSHQILQAFCRSPPRLGIVHYSDLDIRGKGNVHYLYEGLGTLIEDEIQNRLP